eukprot:TRINITY_DN13610_c0_g1_i1.p1 TRINITY_DN13610_c0_g1~~TRINITY_DN13610_c0_g1_i1.p1  ORF type:complete len:437 (-),score=85.53 TRINITY_DN13610_c0_g1_i1:532-1842(-)
MPSLTEKEVERNFWWFATWFALNHGTVTTPLVVASSLLDEDSAYAGNGLLYVGTCLSSLLLGAPLVGSFGAKNGLLFGMFFYCVYVIGFTLSAVFPQKSPQSAATWLIGSGCGGVAAGVLWTAQGSYFATSATLLSEARQEPRETLTASLAGKFAMVYLVLEVASKLFFSFLQTQNVDTWIIGVVFSGLAMLSLGMMLKTKDIGRQAQPVRVDPLAKLFAAASLWSDPIIWLLSPTNFVFGFCAAFMNGYVNANFTSKELGADVVTAFAAVTALTAAAFAGVFGWLGSRIGKGPVLVIGHLCFMAIPIILFVGVSCLGKEGCRSGWGDWLIVLYLLQGIGRAVYESTNRAAFSDFFTGAATEGAFANCMLQSSLSFAASFFMQVALKRGTALEWIVIGLAAAIFITFPLAVTLKKAAQKRDRALLASSAVQQGSNA